MEPATTEEDMAKKCKCGNEPRPFVKINAESNEIVLLPEGGVVVNKRNLIIADVHLGFEGVMASSGLFMPRVMLEDAKELLNRILRRWKGIETLIIAGDLKHEFSEMHRFEWRDVHAFMEFVLERFERVVVVRGNHDNYLKVALKRHNRVVFEESCYDGSSFMVIHGDKDVLGELSKPLLLMGHEHPALVIKDDVGAVARTRCFLVGKHKNTTIIVLPAFSPIFMGTDIISMPDSELLSPILRRIGIDRFKLYACLEDEILEFPTVGEIRRVLW